MKTIEEQLELHEGFRSRPYRCPAGKLTIGIGRNLDDVGIRPAETVKLGLTKTSVIAAGVSRAQALGLLAYDLAEARATLDVLVPNWRTIDPVRRKVLEDMAFNMGHATLAQFKNTLAAVSRRDFDAAAVGMRKSAWYRQVGGEPGQRGARLVRMMLTGLDYA
ncbi:glycoside hydrolase family protein [Caulobacter segnis]|uniref:Lysozyme n=1 Tax=Caulobacter segnis TaxID=88688 RepID=A0A2W5VCZ6_9CAUL|nr:glycoside hydrolase family protein [Caulobacter segnis]PZR37172.1 MAG: lysozyme [Caulobacter segnis]